MKKDGIQLRIGDLIYAVLKRWKLIISLTVVSMVFGLFLSGMTYVQSTFQTYNISGSAAITTLSQNGYLSGSKVATMNDFNLSENMVEAVQYIIRSDRVLESVINGTELVGTSSAQIRNGLSVSQYGGTQILTISLRWGVAEDGIRIWDAIISETSKLLPQTLQIGSLAVINNPTATAISVGGSENSAWMVLALLGFIAGIGFAVIGYLLRPTLTNTRDVETLLGLETFGIILSDSKYSQNNWSLLTTDENNRSTIEKNFASTAYILRNRIGRKSKPYSFYVTSTSAREGKTTTAANLAVQLSNMECRTLLIDFNTKNPTLSNLFLENVEYTNSLNALYRGEITKEEAITHLTGYLDILPTVLEREAITIDGQIKELVQSIGKDYDYIIMDAPALGDASSTLALNQIADAALFVIGYDIASIPEIQNALRILEKSGIRILGSVVNAAPFKAEKIKSRKRRNVEKGGRRVKHYSEETVAESSPENVIEANNKLPQKGKELSENKQRRNYARNVLEDLEAGTVSATDYDNTGILGDLLNTTYQNGLPEDTHTPPAEGDSND